MSQRTRSVSEPFQTSMNHYVAPKRMTFKDKGALVRSVHTAFIHIIKAEGDRSLQALKKKVYDTISICSTHSRSSCSFNKGLIGHLIA